jgi:pimeloyl-ACP methyl ester carboxylesterase
MRTHSHPVEATGEPAPSVCQVLRKSLVTTFVLISLVGCSSASTSETTLGNAQPTVTSNALALGGTINWKSCSGDELDPTMCATFQVPYDYKNPSVGQFSLNLVKHPAAKPQKRIGSMLVNPGGPGFGGAFLAEDPISYFGGDLVDSFDIIGWDPRGTGKSTPAVDCIDNYDTYFTTDPSPQNAAEKKTLIDATRLFTEECEKKSGAILPYVSTNNTVRDMDSIRAALGEEKITYFGFSYGSELGATWLTMFPTTVRAAVLDGASDPNADYIQSGLDQAKGFEKQFAIFLKECSQEVTCAFHNKGDAEGAYEKLMEELDARPLVVGGKRAPVNQAVAFTAIAQAMYSSTMWGELEQALADAQKGKGAGLLSLNDDYYQRKGDGTYGNELEAFNAILCLDDPGPLTVEETDSYLPKFEAVAPRLAHGFTSGYGCVFWKAPPDRRIAITGKGAGPVIVIGTTGDPATPLESSRRMATALEDGRLIVVTANRHTGYGENDCVTTTVNKYLLTASVTFAEKAC